METIGIIYDNLSMILLMAFFVLAAIASGRVIYRIMKGKSVHITPVGVAKDLPSDVTGGVVSFKCSR